MHSKIKKMTDIDSYAGLQKEISGYLQNLEQEELNKIDYLTFALIGPDGLVEGNINGILNTLKSSNLGIVDYKFSPSISERLIEDLYKFSVPDAVKTMPHYLDTKCDIKDHCPYMSFIPTRNWRILRKRFMLGPSLSLILYGNTKNTAKELKALKGPTDPLKCSESQIRRYTDNPVFSRIHSSDDPPSVVRESILFFGTDRFINLLKEKEKKEVDYKKIKTLIDIIIPDQKEFRFPLISVLLRLRVLINCNNTGGYVYEFYYQWKKVFNKTYLGKNLLELYTSFLMEEVNMLSKYKDSIRLEDVEIFSMMNSKINSDVDIEKLILKFKIQDVFISEQEKLVLESGIWYYRDVETGEGLHDKNTKTRNK